MMVRWFLTKKLSSEMVKIEVQKYLLDNSFFGPDIIIACGSKVLTPTNEGMENYLQMYQLS